ncbi:hypothetical protein BHM03_00001497 [Ensete ventricosum]|nr:hypothetical protein BHM03_00001497 [Ensete ventricosum]
MRRVRNERHHKESVAAAVHRVDFRKRGAHESFFIRRAKIYTQRLLDFARLLEIPPYDDDQGFHPMQNSMHTKKTHLYGTMAFTRIHSPSCHRVTEVELLVAPDHTSAWLSPSQDISHYYEIFFKSTHFYILLPLPTLPQPLRRLSSSVKCFSEIRCMCLEAPFIFNTMQDEYAPSE